MADEWIVVVGGTDWDGVRASERHLAEQLSLRGPVLWVDPPVSALRADGLNPFGGRPEVTRTGSTVRLTPTTVPGVTRLILRDVAARQCRRAIRSTLRDLGGQARAIIVASTIDLLDAAPGAVRVFYGTDDFVAGANLMGMDAAWVARSEARQVRRSDLVLAVSEPLCSRWEQMGGNAVLFPNGADTQAMRAVDDATPAQDVVLPHPIAGLVGHVSDRIDISLLGAVVDRGLSLLIVGPTPRTSELPGLAELAARPNVQVTGPRPFEELPSYYRHMAVGLTPYRDTAFNRASFPLKTLEYLAAGLPVVTSVLPASDFMDSPLIATSSNPQKFAELAFAATAIAADPELIAERRTLADRFSWSRKADELLTLIDAIAESRRQ